MRIDTMLTEEREEEEGRVESTEEDSIASEKDLLEGEVDATANDIADGPRLCQGLRCLLCAALKEYTPIVTVVAT